MVRRWAEVQPSRYRVGPSPLLTEARCPRVCVSARPSRHPGGGDRVSTRDTAGHLAISNDSAGYAELLGWICQHSPGFRLAVSIEGSRSYDVGPARPIAAAGLVVIHCEQPTRKQRRGKGKSDPIDARMSTGCPPRAPTVTAKRYELLSGRHELTTATTGQINRLRAR
jgi:hypothetical protein